MQRHTGERGAALILLIGITAALAVLTAALVMLLANQQGATANERTTKTSLYFAEGALDSALNATKATTASGTNFSTGPTAIDTTQVNTQYLAAYPPPAPTPTYRVYDNAATITASTPAYDANLDHRVWVEATVTYLGHTSRLRQMLDSSTSTSILPQAALYADTDIVANGTSNAYAVKKDGTFYTSGVPPYVTSIMAGDDFTGAMSTNLAPPGQTKQSLGIKVNDSVSLPGITENGVTIGGVGLLSDYFDQARQYALSTESQIGIPTKAVDPTSPSVPTVPGTTMTSGQRTTIQGTSPQTYTAPTDFYYNGNLTLSAASGSSTFTFRRLYLTGSLTVTGNVTVNATDLRVGSLAVSGATTAKTLSLGPVYVTGNVSVSGTSAFNTTSMYTGGTFTITGPATSITHTLGPLYAVGAVSVSARAVVNATNVHAGSTFTITGPTTTPAVTDTLGMLYANGNIALANNVQVNTTALYTGAGFTIRGNTTNVTDQFGPIYVTGTADWDGGSGTSRLVIQTTSLTSTTWADPTTPGPMYAQILAVDGDTNGDYDGSSGAYDLTLGDVWIDGNAGTGNVAVTFAAPTSGTNSTVMCPLLATTEKTVTNGRVDFGTLTDPMVYYMQCDNDGLYSNTCEWGSTGTFTGLAVIMEAALQITGGNDGTGAHPNFVGSVMAGTPISPDITLSSNSTVCYNQAAIDNLPANLQSILRTLTTTTVSGTWQQL